jgi:hypothetical protein
MRDSLGILGQRAAAATTVQVLYTAPSLAQTTISTLVICNRGSTQLTFRLSAHVADANPSTPDNAQYLFYDTPIDGNTTITVTIGITMKETDTLRIYASATGLSFNVFGVESS